MRREPQIMGFGGYVESEQATRQLLAHTLALTGVSSPRVLFLPTAVGDDERAIVRFYERCGGLGQLSHLRFFPWPPPNARELVLGQDAICVSGGNTANMLAIWRAHAFDQVLREAWERGILLFGGSAGLICWFEAGVTDSFGPKLEGLKDGLGFLSGSACPHYDGEARRRPRYRELVAEGFPAGLALDDGVGAHYLGTTLQRIVSVREGAGAYRVSATGEEPLAVDFVGGSAPAEENVR
jgi:peptidase E